MHSEAHVDLGLDGKVALVTGGGGGLGGAAALALATEGVRVGVASRTMASAEGTASSIIAAGGKALSLAWDLGDLGAVDAQLLRLEQAFGPVDILVVNTGGPPPTPVAGQSTEVWEKFFRSMVLSVISLSDRLLPSMKQRGWGRIITSTSSGAIAPIPNLGISNTLRLSLMGWSKTLAREVATSGITCNVVVPGRIATDRVAALDRARAEREGRNFDEIVADSLRTIPTGRYGRPEEYGAVVAFLASQQASYVTGSTIRVDGGLIASV